MFVHTFLLQPVTVVAVVTVVIVLIVVTGGMCVCVWGGGGEQLPILKVQKAQHLKIQHEFNFLFALTKYPKIVLISLFQRKRNDLKQFRRSEKKYEKTVVLKQKKQKLLNFGLFFKSATASKRT
jgi:hypothetical protein